MGTYELTVKGHFDAAHHLYGYPGECRELHGHTWDVEVAVSSGELDGIGIVYDFKSLKADLESVISDYDHVLINEVSPFDEISPTAENLARVICERLQGVVDPGVRVTEVVVWESPSRGSRTGRSASAQGYARTPCQRAWGRIEVSRETSPTRSPSRPASHTPCGAPLSGFPSVEALRSPGHLAACRLPSGPSLAATGTPSFRVLLRPTSRDKM